jgi:erythromycin esterase
MAVKFLLALVFLLINLTGTFQPEPGNTDLISYFSSKAIPFHDASGLDLLIKKCEQKQLVLLGEASHGTHEYYHWRAEITKRLITEKGYRFIAVEGDWASIYRLNKYVKGLDNAMSSVKEVLLSFNRWPEWMWANTDILELAEWLKDYNKTLSSEDRVGFYGIDVYGQWEAMEDLLAYTNEHLAEKHNDIVSKLNCFAGYGKDEWHYAREVAGGKSSCEEELQQVVDILRDHGETLDSSEKKTHFRAKQNALVVQNAENYYRLAIQNNMLSWNSRVDHMWITIQRLFKFYGEDSKGIVWAHNTHVGDSRATTMRAANMNNIGKLSRENLGEENVYIAGFGTFRGKVNAGTEWGAPMQIMRIPKAQEGSLDHFLGQVPHEQFFILFKEEDRKQQLLAANYLGHRAIGVTYNPQWEAGNYEPTLPAFRYDALLFFQKTSALKPVSHEK